MVEQNQQLTRRRLLEVVGDTALRGSLGALLELADQTLDQLHEMEESLYKHYVQSGKSVVEMANALSLLEAVAERTLVGARRLDVTLQSEAATWPVGGGAAVELEFDIDDDPFGVDEVVTDPLGSAGVEIDGMLKGIGDPDFAVDAPSMSGVREELVGFGRALHARLADFDTRFREACEGQRFGEALRELDVLSNIVSDQVLQLLEGLHRLLLGASASSAASAGHHTTLERALLVRRELAKLRRMIAACNTRIQDPAVETTMQQQALDRLTTLLDDFCRSGVFEVMRAADRLALRKLQQGLDQQPLQEARLFCQACARHLDAMSSINQRRVLVRYDRKLQQEITELLRAAENLFTVSIRGGAQLVKDAYARAHLLYGKSRRFDEMLQAYRAAPPSCQDPKKVEAAAIELASKVAELGG